MTIFRDLTETRELVDSFTRPAETLLPVSRLRDDPAGEGARWGSLAELGWLAIGLPEDAGGVGLSAVEEALAAHTFRPPPDLDRLSCHCHCRACPHPAGRGRSRR